jgi:hypothetical protein
VRGPGGARSAWWPALLALAVASAGCAGPGPGGDEAPPSSSSSGSDSMTATPSPPSPTVVDLLPDFALGPCAAVSVRSAQPLDRVQALLPPGFAAAPFGTEETGMAAVDLYACGNLTTPTARVPGTVYGQVYTLVQRPEVAGVPAPEGALHEYVFRVLAGEDVLASLWPSAGYDTRAGPASVAVDALPGVPLEAGARTGTGSVGADYAALAQGHAGAPPLPLPAWSGPFARYTMLADGSVLLWTGAYDVPRPFQGQGSFSVAGDDPFAGFEAAERVPGAAWVSESATMAGLRLQRVFP